MAASKRMKRHHALEKIPFRNYVVPISFSLSHRHIALPSCAPQNGTPRKFQHFAADTFENAYNFSRFCRQFSEVHILGT